MRNCGIFAIYSVYLPYISIVMFHTIATFLPVSACLCQTLNICLYSSSRRKHLTVQRLVLLISVAYTMLTFFGAFMIGTEHYSALWDICNLSGYMLLFPTFLLYVKLIMEPDNTVLHDWMHYTIPITLTIAVCVVYGLMSPDERIYYMEHFRCYPFNKEGLAGFFLVQSILHIICRIVYLIQLVILVIKGNAIINRYKEKINDYYSDEAGMVLGYTSRFFHLISTITVAEILYTIIVPSHHAFTGTTYDIISICCAFIIGISCHYSLMQINITDEIYREKIKKNAIEQSTETVVSTIQNTNANAISLKNQVTIVIEREQLYLKSNLKASELAQVLNITQAQLQVIINTHFGTSFSGLINRYRINHAKNIMKEQPNTPIYIVAEMSGYATEMSFYNNFKLITGTTPTAWKRQKGL